MKTIIIALMLLASMTSRASEGTRGGGNGDTAEFYRVASASVSVLKTSLGSDKNVSVVLVQKLEAALTSVVVLGREDESFVLGGRVVQAINYPDLNKIEFSMPSWEKLTSAQKVQLALHELLGLIRVDDSRYEFSTALTQMVFANVAGQESTSANAAGKRTSYIACGCSFAGGNFGYELSGFTETTSGSYRLGWAKTEKMCGASLKNFQAQGICPSAK